MLAHWLQVQTRLPFKRVDRTCSSAGNLLQRDHFVLYCTSSEPLLSALSMRSILDFKVSPAGGKHLGVNLSTLEDMSPFMWGFFLYKYIYWCGKIVSLGMNRKDEKDSSRCLDGQLYPSIAKKKKKKKSSATNMESIRLILQTVSPRPFIPAITSLQAPVALCMQYMCDSATAA